MIISDSKRNKKRVRMEREVAKIESLIEWVEEDPLRRNFRVTGFGYINAEIKDEILFMNHEDGLVRHYHKVADDLRSVLNGGRITRYLIHSRAPEFVWMYSQTS